MLCCLTYLILEMREELWESIKKYLWALVFHTPRIVHPGINLNTFSCPLHLVDIRKPWSSNLTQDESGSDSEFLPALTLLNIINHSSPRVWAEKAKVSNSPLADKCVCRLRDIFCVLF